MRKQQIVPPQMGQSGVRPGQRMTKMTKEQKVKAQMERKQGYRRQEQVQLPIIPVFIFFFVVTFALLCIVLTIGGWLGIGSGVTSAAMGGIVLASLASPCCVLYFYNQDKERWDEFIKDKYKEVQAAGGLGGLAAAAQQKQAVGKRGSR